MRVVTWNVNGFRAAIRKGVTRFVRELKPDVWLIQEVRAEPEQLPGSFARPRGWRAEFHPSQRAGYSGVATWSRADQERLSVGVGPPGARGGPDEEGRVLETRSHGVRFLNVYLPSGSSGLRRQAYKEAWMERFLRYVAPLARSDEPVLIGGDLNIAHTERDIWNHVGNRGNSGFLPQERRWFTRLLDSGWHDLVREQVGIQKGPYSWWSNRGRARALNRGWRIDYLLANDALARHATNALILRRGGLVVSDHAPVAVDFDLPLGPLTPRRR